MFHRPHHHSAHHHSMSQQHKACPTPLPHAPTTRRAAPDPRARARNRPGVALADPPRISPKRPTTAA